LIRPIFLASLAPFIVAVACGARTELLGPETQQPDATHARDAEPDMHDASIDVPVIDDVASGCDGGVTAYLWDVTGNLYTFEPSTLATTLLGPVSCPATEPPWTFSVSRAGFALMIYEDWNIYRVNLTTLACETTAFVPSQLGFDVQGEEAIAISREPNTPEKLYVYGVSNGMPTLAVADPVALVLSEVGAVNAMPQLFPADMQGNAQGDLFVLSNDGQLLELDSANAAVLLNVQTTFQAGDWAVMTYGNQVFFFADGVVSLEDIATQTLTTLGNTNIPVVGASAAPCVP